MLRKWLKRLGYGLGGLLGVAGVAYLVVHAMATFRMARKYEVTHETVAVPRGPEAIARGRHLVDAVTHCNGCHGPDFGGRVMHEDFALGRLVAPNITRGQGGLPADYRVEDWVRVLRHALDREGHPLKIMPSDTFVHLSQEDLGAIIAYLDQVPPVDRDVGASSLGPLGRVLLVADMLPLLPAEKIDHKASAKFAPPAGPTVEYGKYLAQTAGCLHCHGNELQGKPSVAPGFPPPPRLADLTGRWTEADFVRALRTGKRPDGSELDREMPWQALKHMTNDELRALWLYLGEVEPAAPPATAMVQ